VLPAELARSLYAISRQDALGYLVGTGAFRFVSQSNGLLSLAAVDDAWQGRPFVDAVEINGGRSVRNQWLDLSSGRADMVEVPVENLHQAQQEHLAVVESGACDLLVLSVARAGILQEDAQREAVALAVDRAALYNVIFQKQGEMTAGLLPNSLTGYSFLFPKERDLARAQTLRGGANGAPLTLTVEGASAVVQLAAERIALNLREAGFRVQVVPHNSVTAADLTLRVVHLESDEAQAALEQMLGAFNQSLAEESNNPATLYHEESGFLQTHQAVPLLYLPRAYGVGPRVYGLQLSAYGIPMLDDVSVEDAK
jgi:peptide/nickel transport system substrate-binding protein